MLAVPYLVPHWMTRFPEMVRQQRLDPLSAQAVVTTKEDAERVRGIRMIGEGMWSFDGEVGAVAES